MKTDREIFAHYSRGNLLSRLNAALREDGVDPDHPSVEALAPYDQFHGRGLEATLEIAGLMQAGPADHILMNIADKGAFYREIHRVLKPGAWLVLSEIAKGEGPDLDYPTPWASSAGTSFLSTPEETQRGLQEAGFDVIRLHSTLEEARAFGARSHAMVERGDKPLHRAVMLIHGEIATQAMTNTSRGVSEARIVPIEVLAYKRTRAGT